MTSQELWQSIVGLEILLSQPKQKTENQAKHFRRKPPSLAEIQVSYRHLFDNTQSSVARYRVVFDNDGKPTDYVYTDVNPSFERMSGRRRCDLIGKRLTEMLPGVEQRMPILADTYRRALAETSGVHIEHYLESLGRWYSGIVCALKPGDVTVIFDDITERKLAEDALRESDANYRAIFNAANDAIFIHDSRTGQIIDANQKAAELTGYMQEEVPLLQVEMTAIDDPEFAPERAMEWLRKARDEGPQIFEWKGKTRDGQELWVEVNLKRATIGGRDRIIAIVRDISERKRADQLVHIQTSAINAASDMVVITDYNGLIEFVNRSFEAETGYASEDVVGKHVNILRSNKHDKQFYAELWKTVLAGNVWQGEIISRRKDGSMYTEQTTITPVKNSDGVIEHFVGIKRNITDKKVYEEQLDHQAHHDAVTGLPNRLLFSDRLTQSLSQARRFRQLLAVMFLDLDRFKLINDTLGHTAGDGLLKAVAIRLKDRLRDVDTISRMGGDEFTIITTGLVSSQDAVRVAKKVLDAFSQPFTVQDQELFITASIGISMYPADGVDVETLVRNADAAMYRAKEHGGNIYHLYTEELNAAAFVRMTLENALRRAVERHEFVLHYQPRVDIKTGKILGVEALVRWQHPELGLVPPLHFIPLAEETGLIVPVSEWVIKTACRQAKAWQDAGVEPIDIAVNISPRQFQQKDLRAVVRKTLKETGLDPKYLNLELTEGALMQNTDHAAEILHKLKAMGVRISIDDFGTGYSSLSYLKRFPVDAVKIDQSFIRDITTDPDDAAIAGAVTAMAHALKLKVIAEGVETLEQLEFLRSLNCDEMQGYFISKPLPADDITQMLIESSDPFKKAA